MKRIFGTFLSLCIFGFAGTCFAGSKLFLYPDFPLNLKGQSSFSEPEQYRWEVAREGEVITTLEGVDFNHTFSEQGQYRIELTITSADGEIERTNTEVVVADDLGRAMPLDARISTFPEMNDQGVVEVSADEPELFLYTGGSTGDVIRYQIDRNITVDSDGDGNPENDIDNSGDPSLKNGSPWRLNLSEDSGPLTARVVITDSSGQTQAADVTIRLADEPKEEQQESIEAKILSFPPLNENGVIRVSGEEAEITFYFRESTGDIIQYRFDRNITVDSDGDGNPENDIDNKDHPSFTTGEPFTTTFSRTDGEEQIIQLVVVSSQKEGDRFRGSRIQRKVMFTGLEALPFDERTPEMNPRLIVDQTIAETDTEIRFHVLGTPAETSYQWDFDGDGTIDETTQASSVTHSYREAGEYQAAVTISSGSVELQETSVITVREPEAQPVPEEFSDPVADFEWTIEQGTVSFVSLSRADPELSDQDLEHRWDFGDSGLSTDKDPVHTYTETGTYTVTLAVTDSQGVEARKTVEIEITEVTENGTGSNPPENEEPGDDDDDDPEVPSDGPDEPDSPNNGEQEVPPADTGGFPFLMIGLILILLVLGGVGLLLFFRKVQHPELSFGEIISEEIERMFGGRPKPKPQSAPAPDESTRHQSTKENVPPEAEAATDEEQADEAIIVEEGEPEAKTAPAAEVEAGPMPEWLKSGEPEDEASTETEAGQQNAKTLPAPEQEPEQQNAEEPPPAPEHGSDKKTAASTTPDQAPEWLQQEEEPSEAQSSQQEATPETESTAEPKPRSDTAAKPPLVSDELPEWLKGETGEEGRSESAGGPEPKNTTPPAEPEPEKLPPAAPPNEIPPPGQAPATPPHPSSTGETPQGSPPPPHPQPQVRPGPQQTEPPHHPFPPPGQPAYPPPPPYPQHPYGQAGVPPPQPPTPAPQAPQPSQATPPAEPPSAAMPPKKDPQPAPPAETHQPAPPPAPAEKPASKPEDGHQHPVKAEKQAPLTGEADLSRKATQNTPVSEPTDPAPQNSGQSQISGEADIPPSRNRPEEPGK